jgi:hypothetical protein
MIPIMALYILTMITKSLKDQKFDMQKSVLDHPWTRCMLLSSQEKLLLETEELGAPDRSPVELTKPNALKTLYIAETVQAVTTWDDSASELQGMESHDFYFAKLRRCPRTGSAPASPRAC